MDFERLGATSITLVLFVLFVIAQGYPLGKAETKEGSMKTAWIYVDTNKQVGDVDHLKVFANPDAADEWFKQHDPEGVVFEYPVIE